MDIEQSERDKLRALFPQCFAEGKLDIDKLLTLCGEYMDDEFEKYEFKWKGKRDCLKLAQMRSTAALRPCEGESVNFDTTQNLYIEGDNLEVLKLLQKAYFRRVKMIYIDPPYNTGNDFVYEDDFSDTLARYKEMTSQATKSNPETMGRFHTNWLNMMYPRLRLAANLLRDDGVIFISIDDGEQANLRKMCDEVFGEENFEGHIHWRRRHNQPNDKTKMIGLVAEHLIAYAKSSDYLRSVGVGKIDLTGDFSNPDNDPRGDWASKPWKVGSDQSGSRYKITTPKGGVLDEEWMGEEATYHSLLADNRIIFPRGGDGMPRKKYFKFEREEEGQCATNWWESTQFGNNQGANDCMTGLFGIKNIFSNPKPVELLRGLLQISNAKSDDIILDFFSGSSTIAHAVMQRNAEDGDGRQFICIQLPELCDEKSEAYKSGFKNICEIGKERIRRAGAHLLEASGQGVLGQPPRPLDIGFKVFKLDSSNLKTWDSSHISAEQQAKLGKRLNTMIERVKPDRTDLDMIYEVMLKLGVPLDFPVTKLDVNGTPAYSVGEDTLLLVCLAPDLTVETLEHLADHAPAKMILAETSFADDSAMSNAYYTLRDRGIEFKFV